MAYIAVMHLLLTQLITAVIATGAITFVVTHLHHDMIAWWLWLLHWSIAVPIALMTVRYVSPKIHRLLQRLLNG